MFHFTANLKPYTFTERSDEERFGAYLLSADYLERGDEMAAQVRAQGRQLVADNGNVDIRRELTATFRSEAHELDEARKGWEEEHARNVRPGDLPRALARRFAGLARSIAEAGAQRLADEAARIAVGRQQQMDPTFLVGMEDLTLGVMAALNLEPE